MTMSAEKAMRILHRMTFSEFPPHPVPKNGTRWGDWKLSTSSPPSLDYVGGHYKYCPYEVVLSNIFRPGDSYTVGPGLLHWMKHLHDKSWGRESMSDFIDAVLTIGRYGYIRGSKQVTVWPEDANEF